MSEKTKQEKRFGLCKAGEKKTSISHKLRKGVPSHGLFCYTLFLLNSETLYNKNVVDYKNIGSQTGIWIKTGS